MSKDIAVPNSTVLAAIAAASTPAERAKLQAASMERVEDPRFSTPVPRFLTELPFGGDDDEITDRIASAVLVAVDPDDTTSTGTTAGKDIVGRAVTVWDLRVLDGDKPGGWGAFLLLDITVGEDEVHTIVNTGAKQVVTRLARAWAEGKLPLRGVFSEIDGTGKQGNKALAFVAEPAF